MSLKLIKEAQIIADTSIDDLKMLRILQKETGKSLCSIVEGFTPTPEDYATWLDVIKGYAAENGMNINRRNDFLDVATAVLENDPTMPDEEMVGAILKKLWVDFKGSKQLAKIEKLGKAREDEEQFRQTLRNLTRNGPENAGTQDEEYDDGYSSAADFERAGADREEDLDPDRLECPACHGDGRNDDGDGPCERCNGKGHISRYSSDEDEEQNNIKRQHPAYVGRPTPEKTVCPQCSSVDIKTYSDGGHTCHSCGWGWGGWDYKYDSEDEEVDGKYPLDPAGYDKRVRELEAEGMTRSDAQGVADVEFAKQIRATRYGKEEEEYGGIRAPNYQTKTAWDASQDEDCEDMGDTRIVSAERIGPTANRVDRTPLGSSIAGGYPYGPGSENEEICKKGYCIVNPHSVVMDGPFKSREEARQITRQHHNTGDMQIKYGSVDPKGYHRSESMEDEQRGRIRHISKFNALRNPDLYRKNDAEIIQDRQRLGSQENEEKNVMNANAGETIEPRTPETIARQILTAPREIMRTATKGIKDEGGKAWKDHGLPKNPHPIKSAAHRHWLDGLRKAAMVDLGIEQPVAAKPKKK